MKSIVLFVLTIAGAISAQAQVENSRRIPSYNPLLFFEAIASASDSVGKSQLDFYVQIPYDELRFVRADDQYAARYEVEIEAVKPDQTRVWDRSTTIEVRVRDFALTSSSKHYSLRQLSTQLEPGPYDVTVNMQDLESKQGTRLKRTILVSDFQRDSISLSDIMLVNRLTTQGEKRSVVPNISGSIVQPSEGVILFLEAYTKFPADSIRTESRVYNEKKDQLYSMTQIDSCTGAKTSLFLKLDLPSLGIGSYQVVVEATSFGKNSPPNGTRASTNRKIFVRSEQLPMTITDIDRAIAQLRYVARETELDSIRAGATEEERRTRFLAFWKKRDPDPQTPRNELMDEYYQRVAYANNNFTTFSEGWKSDRGMIYIRLGAPEQIERHPFDINARPYEIWYYYTQNREFVFVDESGFGDYRLRYPTTDLWGRVKD